MKILHVVAPATVGGIESVVVRLVEMQGRHHDVHVAAVVDSPAAGHSFLQACTDCANAELHVLDVPASRYLKERSWVRRLVNALEPDVLHTHGYRSDTVHGFGRSYQGVARVSTLHGFTLGSWRKMIYNRLQLRVLRRFDAVIAVSRELEARLVDAGVESDRIHRIPNAIQTQEPVPRGEALRQLELDTDRFNIGWIGRTEHDKGIDLVLQAVAGLEGVPWTLSVIGGGPARGTYRSMAERLGVADRCRWYGELPEAGSVLTAFDVFVLSSRREGTPIVLLEAMTAGTPIIATRVGGVPDLLPPGTALLVPPDRSDALRQALLESWRDPEGAARRAAGASARRSYTLTERTWLDRHEAVYRAATRRETI